MSSTLLCARLGPLHPLLLTVCQQRLEEPKVTLKRLIETELSRRSGHPSTPKSNKRIRFSLGDMHSQFVQHCKQIGMSANTTLSDLVAQEIQRTLQVNPSRPHDTHDTHEADSTAQTHDAHTHQVHIAVGTPDRASVRVELRMRQSELDAIGVLAKQRHTTAQRLINQIVRAFLLKTPAFSQEDITTLGAINFSLKRLGTNLNQIARHMNAQEVTHPAQDEAHAQIMRCVDEINTYVLSCANLLQLSREKWRIELKD